MNEKQAISRIEGLIDPYPCGADFSTKTVEALKMAVEALRKQTCRPASREAAGTAGRERCSVGGIDRSGEVDRIDIQTAMETPFWMSVWATEPEREVDVRMSYSNLKVLIDCFENVKRFVNAKKGETS